MSRRCLVVSVLLSASVLAAPPTQATNRAAEREALKKALVELAQRGPLKQARLGVQILSLDDGSVVWSKDADALMNPASNVKLVTAAAALFLGRGVALPDRPPSGKGAFMAER